MSQEQDKTLKLISKKHIISFLKMLDMDIDLDDIDESEIQIITDEQISIEPSLYRPDFIVIIKDIILMFEYQSTTLRTNDKKRFKVYISNFDLKINTKNLKIIFAVISTAQKSKMIEYCINDWDCFKFPLISLLNLDEKEIISNIKYKIHKQEEFSEIELIKLSLTPLMVQGRENIIRQFKQTSNLMANLNFPNNELKESIYGISLMLANMYFDKDDPMRKKIEGDFMMKVDCVQEAIQESKNQGIEEGKILLIKEQLKDNKITANDAIIYLLSANCKLEEISKITNTPINQIKTIQNQK